MSECSEVRQLYVHAIASDAKHSWSDSRLRTIDHPQTPATFLAIRRELLAQEHKLARTDCRMHSKSEVTPQAW